jgi:CHAT domain-containing protein/tetratricopeptide (TPR) repeat protein
MRERARIPANHGFAAAVATALVAALAGCQIDGGPPAVSLDQAKKIAASFEGQGFTPPPRTIADITAILDQEKPDPAKAEAARKAADAEPPAGAAPAQLARFYYDRALAAAEIGRLKQRRDDAAEAVRLGREGGGDFDRSLQQLGFAELAAGRVKAALAIHEERLRSIPADARGRTFSVLGTLAIGNARRGNLDEANRWMARAESLLQESAGWRQARPFFRTDWRVQVLNARGILAESGGRFAEAEANIREAVRLIETVLIPGWAEEARFGGPPPGSYENFRDVATVNLARALLRQGRLVEAEVEARRALLSQLKRRGKYAPEIANFYVFWLANVIQEQGRPAEAEKLALAMLDILEKTGVEPGTAFVSNARRLLARAQSQQGRWRDAFGTYAALLKDIEGDADAVEQFLGANINYAMVLLRAGQAAAALPIIEQAIARRTRNLGERHYDTAEARAWLGVALARSGEAPRALAEFRAALPILLSPSRQVDDEEGGGAARDQRLQAIVESYMAVLADARAEGAAEEAFRLADAARGRSVQRALAASSARAAAADPALADLVRREQDAQKQVSALRGLLTGILSQPTHDQDPAGVQALRVQIDSLRSARAAIREEIERRFPDYVNLIDPRPATIEQARKDLRSGEALIATYVGEERTFAWAVPHQGPVAFAAAPLAKAEIGRMVADLRRALDPNAATLGDIPAFDVGLAHRLFAALLKPVEAGWKDANGLLVVPHGALGQLPFAVLVSEPAELKPDREGEALFTNYRGVPFLARRAAITQLPSVASLGSLRRLPAPPPTRRAFVGFGDPWFSSEQAAQAARETQVAGLTTRGARTLVQTRGLKLVRRSAPATQTVDSAELAQLPRLPDTADEVRAIAVALNADPAKDVFTGREANERNVRTMDLANRRVVMFATHGLVPGDLNGLTQPALALSAPNVADVDGDGLLTLDEVLALKLDADWVVLSACNTATGDGAGAEAVSGLGRAFFYAGTRALLVSNWPVETTSARALTTDLFRRQAENPALARAEALRRAMVGLIDGPGYVEPDGKQTVFSYAHPIFWAPFSLVGDGGGGQPGA